MITVGGPVQIDRTQPAVTATFKNADGSTYTPGTWTNQPVTVSFACTDALSGVQSFSGPQTFSFDASGAFASGSCTDVAGNVASQLFGPMMIDRTLPFVSVSLRTADGSF